MEFRVHLFIPVSFCIKTIGWDCNIRTEEVFDQCEIDLQRVAWSSIGADAWVNDLWSERHDRNLHPSVARHEFVVQRSGSPSEHPQHG